MKGKGEIACNKQFLLSPLSFLSTRRTFWCFCRIWFSRFWNWRLYGEDLTLYQTNFYHSSTMKFFADSNSNDEIVTARRENFVGKGENDKHFLLFPTIISTLWYISSIIWIILNPFPHNNTFWRPWETSLFKTLWEKEKLLVTSNFSFSHSVFYLFG